MNPWPRTWVAIGRAVVYYAWDALSFSAGFKCRHCNHGMGFAHLFNNAWKNTPGWRDYQDGDRENKEFESERQAVRERTKICMDDLC